jgi:hypothetical protein
MAAGDRRRIVATIGVLGVALGLAIGFVAWSRALPGGADGAPSGVSAEKSAAVRAEAPAVGSTGTVATAAGAPASTIGSRPEPQAVARSNPDPGQTTARTGSGRGRAGTTGATSAAAKPETAPVGAISESAPVASPASPEAPNTATNPTIAHVHATGVGVYLTSKRTNVRTRIEPGAPLDLEPGTYTVTHGADGAELWGDVPIRAGDVTLACSEGQGRCTAR